MSSSLLKTKLQIPPVQANLVPRPLLVRRLDESLTHPLTLISAPPGFGKTTLLTAWLKAKDEGGRMMNENNPAPLHPSPLILTEVARSSDLPPSGVAWYSLDDHDNDLARFLAYWVAAIETVQPGFEKRALHRLHSRRRPTPETAMTLLSNAITEIPFDFILVLDDYHLIELQAIHEAMSFLMDHLPSPLHLIIATRADPPFLLTRLRARGQLVEVRAPDLRFTPEEAATFLNQRMGLNLLPEQVDALEARTEGWIAGLQLAALSMQRRSDAAEFVKAFTGSHHFILDYLIEEVLQRQAPEIQAFLLQTSILSQMNAALADAVTERNDSAQVLMQLERANLFVVPLDDAHQWYRYHHLFEDLLRSRLQQTRPELAAPLHQKASLWYEQNGFVNEAIDHALAVPEFDRAARLIERAGLDLLMRSEDATLQSWIEGLPDDLVRARPLLSLLDAMSLAGVGKMDLASARLAQVDDAQLDPQAHQIADALRTFFALYQTDLPHAIQSARENLASYEASIGDLADPQAELNTIAVLFLTIILVELQVAAGRLRDAAAACRHALDLGKSIASSSPWAMALGFVHYQLAEVLYEWNEIKTAAEHTAKGLEICGAGRNEEFESYGLVTLAQVKEAQGDSASAFDLVQRAAALARKRNVNLEMIYIAARRIRVLVTQGWIDDAAQVVSELPPEDATAFDTDKPLAFITHAASTARARVLIARREWGQAAQSLETLCGRAQANYEVGVLIEALALLSIAQQAQGHLVQATTTLARALSLAEPEGYVRTFVDLGEPMAELIARIRDEGGRSPTLRPLAGVKEYAGKIAGAFGGEASIHPSSFILHPSGALLSERELAVLRLMAEGLSNQEIADRLVVAVSTVKTHINNIYSKLGAENRIQALARARERRLL